MWDEQYSIFLIVKEYKTISQQSDTIQKFNNRSHSEAIGKQTF